MPGNGLKFKVTPHIIEDLGLNLYTSLARVLVEFVANAHDADADEALITLDKEAIDDERRKVRKKFEAEKQAAGKVGAHSITPLAKRELSSDISIAVSDDGHGMTRDELENKFLVVGRRRLKEEPEGNGRTAEKQRPLMGRKGLGKLAGFGVARKVTVTSRATGAESATQVVLDFDRLLAERETTQISIPAKQLTSGADFESVSPSGTRIELSRLLYDPTKNRADTISRDLADHFEFIEDTDFKILLDGEPVPAKRRNFKYAHPQPTKARTKLVLEKLEVPEENREFTFSYRLRFTGDGEALPAARRGVRVYVNGRLASAPSLLDADTNMHGFRMTDYLDGVVHADFLADEELDYIATDRQSLLWETPVLERLREFLSDEIKEACKQYQKLRDKTNTDAVKTDPFTLSTLDSRTLTKSERRMAFRIAGVLAVGYKRGLEDPLFKSTFPQIVAGIGTGQLLATIRTLSESAQPDLRDVLANLARLSLEEVEQFQTIVQGRLDGIQALKKIVDDQDFAKKENEGEIQELFEQNPWLIRSRYAQFISADQQRSTMYAALAKTLKIRGFAPSNSSKADKERPDLVTLIGDAAYKTLVIIELKSANTELQASHLQQLEAYMADAEQWLSENGHPDVRVLGELIGTTAEPKNRSRGVLALRRRIDKEWKPGSDWKVRSYVEVLNETEIEHKEFLDAQDRTRSS